MRVSPSEPHNEELMAGSLTSTVRVCPMYSVLSTQFNQYILSISNVPGLTFGRCWKTSKLIKKSLEYPRKNETSTQITTALGWLGLRFIKRNTNIVYEKGQQTVQGSFPTEVQGRQCQRHLMKEVGCWPWSIYTLHPHQQVKTGQLVCSTSFQLKDSAILCAIEYIYHYILYWLYILYTIIILGWRRKWQPTPVFLPRESCGWRSLVGCCP